MKKFLFKIVFFCLISVIIYPFLIGSLGSYWLTQRRLTKNLIFNQGGNSHMWTRLNEVDTISNIDVLILGTSRAYRGIDTRNFEKLGLRTFNLGSNMQTPIQTEYLLNKYLTKLNPKIVIWEVSLEIFSNKGIESFIDISSNSVIDFPLLRQGLRYNNPLIYNNIIITKYRQIFGNYFDYKEKYNKASGTYISNGFVDVDPSEFEDGDLLYKVNSELLDYQMKSFQNSIELLNQKGVKIFLVNSPLTTKYYDLISNKDELKIYLNSFQLRGEVEKFMMFNDIYPDFGHNYLYFSDNMHLNKLGVSIYNKLLLDQLELRSVDDN